ncbi:hypothetical protein J4729_07220 [Leisingera sp. HS039]|uniref:hypothetical protein n=1 Tax=Leisingera sp. HS039 TaxID=2818496 RepID=UPI001B39E256|nr:hypothetical protein [Leisingera sp. HS039]MBQ4824341.1 hypothetical protein [Leisingera sp. HS039]
MADHGQTKKPRELDASDRAIFLFARQAGIIGGIFFFIGAIATVASSNQTSWDAARSVYLTMTLAGPLGIVVGQRLVKILRKHRHIDVHLLDRIT